jgi:hypothetical protein
MPAENHDMHSGNPSGPDEKKILGYLSGSLPDAEKARFEEELPADPFLQDAVEGLRALPEGEKLPEVLSHLNRQLQHQLAHKKSRRKQKALRYEAWLYWTIGLILLIVFIAFILLRLMLKR